MSVSRGKTVLNYNELNNTSLYGLGNMTFSDFWADIKTPPIFINLWIWPFFFWITFLVGVVGNWMVIYVVVRTKQMRTVTNFFLLNLAIADILYLLTAIPSITYWTNYWPCGEFMCEYASQKDLLVL